MTLSKITKGIAAIGLLLMISSQAIAYAEGLLRQRLKDNAVKPAMSAIKKIVSFWFVVSIFFSIRLSFIRLKYQQPPSRF